MESGRGEGGGGLEDREDTYLFLALCALSDFTYFIKENTNFFKICLKGLLLIYSLSNDMCNEIVFVAYFARNLPLEAVLPIKKYMYAKSE